MVSSTQRVHMNFNSHTERLTYEVVTHFRNANFQQMWTDLHWFHANSVLYGKLQIKRKLI